MKKPIQILFLVLLSTMCFSQTTLLQKIDSLNRLLKKTNDKKTQLFIENQKLDILQFFPNDSLKVNPTLANAMQLVEETKSNNIDVLHRYALILERQGNYNQAKKILEDLKLNPLYLNNKEWYVKVRCSIHTLEILINNNEEVLEQLISLKKEIEPTGNTQMLMHIYDTIGWYYFKLGDLPNEMSNYIKVLNFIQYTPKNELQKHGLFFFDEAKILNNLGASFVHFERDFRTGTKYYYKALHKSKAMGNVFITTVLLSNLGRAYTFLGDYVKAMDYMNESMEYAQKNGLKRFESEAYFNIAEIYYYQKQYHQSNVDLKKGLKIASELDLKYLKIRFYSQFAINYEEIGQLDEAKKYIDIAMQDAIDLNRSFDIVRLYIVKADIYKKEENYVKQLQYLKKALVLAETIKNIEYMSKIDKSISDVYIGKGNYNKGHFYYKKHIETANKMFDKKNAAKIASLELEMEYQRKLNNTKREAEKKALAQSEEIENQKTLSIVLGLGVLVLLLSSVIIYILYKQRNKAVGVLEDQKIFLQKLNDTNSRLLTIIGHDLKNPLLSFKHMVNLAANKEITENESKDYLEEAKQEINGLEMSLENITKWAKSQADGMHPNLDTYNLHFICNYCVKLFKRQFQNKEIQFNYNVDSNLTVNIDKDHLIFILRNIISNAIKFTNKKGVISIRSLKNTDTSCQLIIEDNGIGIPKAKYNIIFKDDPRKIQQGTLGEKGSGLGVNISKELIEKNRGSIKIESDANIGTKVIISIPTVKLVSKEEIPSQSNI